MLLLQTTVVIKDNKDWTFDHHVTSACCTVTSDGTTLEFTEAEDDLLRELSTQFNEITGKLCKTEPGLLKIRYLPGYDAKGKEFDVNRLLGQ